MGDFVHVWSSKRVLGAWCSMQVLGAWCSKQVLGAWCIQSRNWPCQYLFIFMSPLHPWGEGGHLDLLWFPVTQMCFSVHPRPRPCLHLYQTLFTQYFLQYITNGFQILRYCDHRQDLELNNFLSPLLNFQGQKGLCFKINFVYVIFPVVLCWWL